MPNQDGHEERPHAEAGQSTSHERIGDGRDREPGVHPTVERTGRSRALALWLVVAMVASAVMFAAIVLGIISPW